MILRSRNYKKEDDMNEKIISDYLEKLGVQSDRTSAMRFALKHTAKYLKSEI